MVQISHLLAGTISAVGCGRVLPHPLTPCFFSSANDHVIMCTNKH
ncbi:unnamed protein product [Linum tenue]|uniref:Uncharacterized protein n=1 Tax=Linum tenue TaxID=586396 RepID=A0AAV0JJQ6_9ROSI|nr:unnamed protein product [Linum tenue]